MKIGPWLLTAGIMLMAGTSVADIKVAGAPVEIEGASEHIITSSVTGETIRILVWVPSGEAPAAGYPVLYAFDGGKHFGHLSDSAETLVGRARFTGRTPAMVVGIGYPKGDYTLGRRNFDLTPPSDHYDMPDRPNGKPWPKMGGGDLFLDTVEKDIKPFVRTHYPADAKRETLFGHSFGGLMVLRALFTRPDSYARFVAASPSIWFNGKQILKDAETFLNAPRAGNPTPIPLRISVGGNEQTQHHWERNGRGGTEARIAWLTSNRMVGNARDLADDLRARGGGKIDLEFDVFDGEDHGSVVPAAIYHALVYAIGD